MTTLLYANPTTTEALLFGLDLDRVLRWLLANGLATPAQVPDASDLKRWFAAYLDASNGQLPVFADGVSRSSRQQELFGLLHTVAHQLLRALVRRLRVLGDVAVGVPVPLRARLRAPPQRPQRVSHRRAARGAGAEPGRGGQPGAGQRHLHVRPQLHGGQRGADHGCLFLPETACRCWNRYLSRHYLYGSPDGSLDRLLGSGPVNTLRIGADMPDRPAPQKVNGPAAWPPPDLTQAGPLACT